MLKQLKKMLGGGVEEVGDVGPVREQVVRPITRGKGLASAGISNKCFNAWWWLELNGCFGDDW